jgi:hypothetical protein
MIIRKLLDYFGHATCIHMPKHIGPCSRNLTQTALKIPNCEGRLEMLYNQKLKATTTSFNGEVP